MTNTNDKAKSDVNWGSYWLRKVADRFHFSHEKKKTPVGGDTTQTEIGIKVSDKSGLASLGAGIMFGAGIDN